MNRPRIGVFALGGTIAMVPGEQGGVRPGLNGADLVAAVPALSALADIEAETAAIVPSPALRRDTLFALAATLEDKAAAGSLDGAVITQGTDTIEESAFLLDCLLDLDIPVVVTGAMRNPQMTAPDGPGNLLAAVRVACDAAVRAQARQLGVLVVMLDDIHAALEVSKASSHRLDAFASPLTGPLGTLIEDRVLLTSLPARPHIPGLRLALGEQPARRLAASEVGAVSLLPLTLDDSGALLHAIAADPQHLGHAGLVLGLMGGGHAPDWLMPAIADLADRLPVVGANRSGGGALLAKTYEMTGGEVDLRRCGVIPAGRLAPLKARLLLDLLLRADCDAADIAAAFSPLD